MLLKYYYILIVILLHLIMAILYFLKLLYSPYYSQTGCSVPWILQYCWEYCNFDCEIALSKLQPTWSNCKLKFTTRFVNKVSDWLLVANKNQFICSEYLIGSSLLLVANQRLCLQIWLWISTCNLITSVANCSEQSRNQNCNIPNNIVIFRGTEHPVWL
jgi:hypothetical protein